MLVVPVNGRNGPENFWPVQSRRRLEAGDVTRPLLPPPANPPSLSSVGMSVRFAASPAATPAPI
jgi:hypothetical protein